MRFVCNGKDIGCDFDSVALRFEAGTYGNVFAKKNNKTLAETLKHHRYKKLQEEVRRDYDQFLSWPIGDFLIYLKSKRDQFYLKFLNKYGDATYSRFVVNDERYLEKKGVYLYTLGTAIRYIGRCKDSLLKRINQGYGKIHPKNLTLRADCWRAQAKTL